jgi:seryl-tRNA synthetase
MELRLSTSTRCSRSAEVRALKTEIEALRAERNAISAGFKDAAPEEKPSSAPRPRRRRAGVASSRRARRQGAALKALMLKLPGIPWEGAPVGPDESFNTVIRTEGAPPKFDFEPLDHVALIEKNDWADLSRITRCRDRAPIASRAAGAARDQADGLGAGADRRGRLHADHRAGDRREQAFLNQGQFPGHEEETYELPNDDLWLAGTAEVALTSLHSGEIIEARQAADPLRRLLALLPPRGGQRRQGRARAAARPPVRQGRAICDLRGRRGAVGRMARAAARAGRELLQALEIPYQVIETSTGDMGLGKYRMNDIESWVPSLGKYRETHSCSTLHDWQARRANLRYRGADGKVRFAHTLNNTALASPRILVPLLENHQTEDGRVRLPKALQELMGGEYL